MNLLLIFVVSEHLLFSNSVQRSWALPASVDVAGTCPHQGTLTRRQFYLKVHKLLCGACQPWHIRCYSSLYDRIFLIIITALMVLKYTDTPVFVFLFSSFIFLKSLKVHKLLWACHQLPYH